MYLSLYCVCEYKDFCATCSYMIGPLRKFKILWWIRTKYILHCQCACHKLDLGHFSSLISRIYTLSRWKQITEDFASSFDSIDIIRPQILVIFFLRKKKKPKWKTNTNLCSKALEGSQYSGQDLRRRKHIEVTYIFAGIFFPPR